MEEFCAESISECQEICDLFCEGPDYGGCYLYVFED